MSAYSDYLSSVRRLLHDANGQFWSDSELLDYINQGRDRVVRDTGCYRILQSRNLTTPDETYSLTTGFPTSNEVFDVLNVTIQWGNSRISLAYMPWTQFNAQLRYWNSNTGRPVVFSVYAYQIVYVAPVPDQVYVGEWDTVCKPPAIVDATTVEVIPYPFGTPVQYFAAHLAKIKEQSWGESEKFLSLYSMEMRGALASIMTRRIPNPYNRA